jgi:hypothetical protein
MTVHLPRDRVAVAPPICLRCGADRATSSVTFWGFSVPWWSFLLLIGIFLTKIARTRFLACPGCAWKLRFRTLGMQVYLIALVVAVVGFVAGWTREWPRWTRRFGGPAIAVVLGLPFLLVQLKWPPVVDIDVDGDEIRYVFTDFRYAQHFQLANDSPAKEVT